MRLRIALKNALRSIVNCSVCCLDNRLASNFARSRAYLKTTHRKLRVVHARRSLDDPSYFSFSTTLSISGQNLPGGGLVFATLQILRRQPLLRTCPDSQVDVLRSRGTVLNDHDRFLTSCCGLFTRHQLHAVVGRAM